MGLRERERERERFSCGHKRDTDSFTAMEAGRRALDLSMRAIDAYKKTLLVDKVTLDDEMPPPVYTLDEISNILSSCSLDLTKEIVEYTFRRLRHRSPHVKRKVLKFIKYTVNKAGSSAYRRELQSCSFAIRELANYQGQVDPFKGNTLNQAVRDAAQEAIKAIFSSDVGLKGKNIRIEGFGSGNFSKVLTSSYRSSDYDDETGRDGFYIYSGNGSFQNSDGNGCCKEKDEVDCLKGNAPNQAVGDVAQDAVKAIFSSDVSMKSKNIRMEGFGSGSLSKFSTSSRREAKEALDMILALKENGKNVKVFVDDLSCNEPFFTTEADKEVNKCAGSLKGPPPAVKSQHDVIDLLSFEMEELPCSKAGGTFANFAGDDPFHGMCIRDSNDKAAIQVNDLLSDGWPLAYTEAPFGNWPHAEIPCLQSSAGRQRLHENDVLGFNLCFDPAANMSYTMNLSSSSLGCRELS